jgi:carbon-monoxide dehydrogenase small subunit
MRLIDILRNNFGLFGAKPGCLSGQCGACTVIYNGNVSPACLIPAFRTRGSEIITIEGYSQTYEYQEIIEGFKLANLENCGYCEAGKILCTGTLLERNNNPARQEIIKNFSGIKCRCTDNEKLVDAVNMIINIRKKRLYGRAG